MKPTELLKEQSGFPRKVVPWFGVGTVVSSAMYKLADMLPEFDWAPDLPRVPVPPAPPWSL